MVDYYAILSRALDAPEAADRSWRRNLYDRARGTLASELRARRPQPTQAEIARELAALEAAVKRIETETACSESGENDSVTAVGSPARNGEAKTRAERHSGWRPGQPAWRPDTGA